MKIAYDGRVLNGKLCPLVKPPLPRLEGWNFRIEFWHGKRRSNKQNRYYYGVILPRIHAMMLEAGNMVGLDECHEFLKKDVGKLVVMLTLPDGSESFAVRSSADLTTAEWEDFMLACRVWAAEWGLDIPPPNEG